MTNLLHEDTYYNDILSHLKNQHFFMRKIMSLELPSDMTLKMVSHFIHTRGIVSLQLASFKLVSLDSETR